MAGAFGVDSGYLLANLAGLDWGSKWVISELSGLRR